MPTTIANKPLTRPTAGFTLIEIVVSLGIFMILITIIIGIFLNITKNSQRSVDAQMVYNDIRLTMELMSREFRTGKNFEIVEEIKEGDESADCAPQAFETKNNYCLKLTNQAGQIITFWVDASGKLFRRQFDETNPSQTYIEQITSDKSNAEIVNLNAILNNSGNEQERITLILKARPYKDTEDANSLLLQTTISSRNYEIQ